MRKKIVVVALIVLALVLLTGCHESVFSKAEEGDLFAVHTGGYSMKLPYGYCLCKDFHSTVKLIKVPEDLTEADFHGSKAENTPPILEGNFKKVHFDGYRLVLLEETESDGVQYVIFGFETEQITRTDSVDDLKVRFWYTLDDSLPQLVRNWMSV